MGFEIQYFYHERNPNGGYNTEEKKELKRKIGKAYDDTPLEDVAKAILSQLARRDIWVVDVELQELVKRQVAFKESKDGRGIIIKGKKFSIDMADGLDVEEYEEADQIVQQAANATGLIHKPQLSAVTVNSENMPPVNQQRVLFRILFTPEPYHFNEIRNKALTIDRKYPVHRQRENPNGGQFGNLYTITDDKGQAIEIDEKYFSIAPVGLMGEAFSNDLVADENKPRLMYDNSAGAAPRRVRVDRSQIPQEYAHLPIDGEDVPMDTTSIPALRPNYVPK